MADARRYRTYDYNYIEGNAVRKLEPAYEPERERPAEPQRKVDPERERRLRQRRKKQNVIDFKFMLVISISCVCVLMSTVSYLEKKSEITSRRSAIVAAQTELSQIVNENVAKEEKLNSMVDLSQIYAKASSEFGMKYADSQHTILYESSDPDYVRQYQDIPESK